MDASSVPSAKNTHECYICLEEVTNTDLLYDINICKCTTEKIHYKCWLTNYSTKNKCDICQECILKYKNPNVLIETGYQQWASNIEKNGTIKIYIKGMNNVSYEFMIKPDTTIEILNSLVYSKFHMPHDQQRIIFNGKKLQPHETLADHNIKDNDTLYLMSGMRGD